MSECRNWSPRVLAVIFLLFLVANTAYLHRVPGLFGDEASEGENAHELLRLKRIVVKGERSYIGPLIDYARVPFVLAFGYSALALRMVMLLASLATFGLAVVVFNRLFGERAALGAVAMMFFSPTYLLYQRLGWAITLFPFFVLLLLFFLTDRRVRLPYRSALAGLAAGVGLHNYFVFLPTIAGVVVPSVVAVLLSPVPVADWRSRLRFRLRGIGKYWLAVLGFWAGFGTQFAVMQLLPEDQGDPAAVIGQFGERLKDLPGVLPLVLSGSSYMARYTGVELPGFVIGMVTLVLIVLVGAALIFSARRMVVMLWVLGLAVQLVSLTFIIDRFTLRYFVVFVLGVWALAGAGVFTLARRFTWAPAVVALVLTAVTSATVLVPYLRTGGSTERFSLGNRTDTAADFVDIRSLVSCVETLGPVWSDNPHIYNRLLYLSHGNQAMELPESKYEAHWLVEHRLPGERGGMKCPELTHFKVSKRK